MNVMARTSPRRRLATVAVLGVGGGALTGGGIGVVGGCAGLPAPGVKVGAAMGSTRMAMRKSRPPVVVPAVTSMGLSS